MKKVRQFGKCKVRGCKTRMVRESGYFDDYTPIHFNGGNAARLKEAGIWCADHDRPVWFEPLNGSVDLGKECGPRCMSAVGPSCECECGGENHGLGRIVR